MPLQKSSGSIYYTCRTILGNKSSSFECSLHKSKNDSGEICECKLRTSLKENAAGYSNKFQTLDLLVSRRNFCPCIRYRNSSQSIHVQSHLKESEDSGVSSRKCDMSSNTQCELSAIEKCEGSTQIKDEVSCSCSDSSKRYPIIDANLASSFKRLIRTSNSYSYSYNQSICDLNNSRNDSPSKLIQKPFKRPCYIQ